MDTAAPCGPLAETLVRLPLRVLQNKSVTCPHVNMEDMRAIYIFTSIHIFSGDRGASKLNSLTLVAQYAGLTVNCDDLIILINVNMKQMLICISLLSYVSSA